MRLLLLLLALIPVLVNIQPAAAQNSTCPAIVETALQAVDDLCADTGRNQACYGNLRLEAEPRQGVTDLDFAAVGDIADVTDIQRLSLRSMDVEAGVWGVALMRLQANLPDTLPGQNVTFLLFGDVEITNAVDDAASNPMQAFYLRTGIGDSRCEEAPDSGLLVQTPEGVGEVAFTVNDVEVQMGSTVLFQADAGDSMIVTTIEGSAAIRLRDRVLPVVAGTLARLRLNENLGVESLPELVEAYQDGDIRALPLRALARQITARTPLTPRQMRVIVRRLQAGDPLCGDDPLPPCDRLPSIAGGLPCVLPSRVDQLSEEERTNRPVCEVEETHDATAAILQQIESTCGCTFTTSEADSRPECNPRLALWALTIAASMADEAPEAVTDENLNLLLQDAPDIARVCDLAVMDELNPATPIPDVRQVMPTVIPDDAIDDALDEVDDALDEVDDALDDVFDEDDD